MAIVHNTVGSLTEGDEQRAVIPQCISSLYNAVTKCVLTVLALARGLFSIRNYLGGY